MKSKVFCFLLLIVSLKLFGQSTAILGGYLIDNSVEKNRGQVSLRNPFFAVAKNKGAYIGIEKNWKKLNYGAQIVYQTSTSLNGSNNKYKNLILHFPAYRNMKLNKRFSFEAGLSANLHAWRQTKIEFDNSTFKNSSVFGHSINKNSIIFNSKNRLLTSNVELGIKFKLKKVSLHIRQNIPINPVTVSKNNFGSNFYLTSIRLGLSYDFK
jgi:hypothetical protein